MSRTVRMKLDRLKEVVGRRPHWQEPVASLKRMRDWIFTAEHILSGTWADSAEALTNATVAERFDRWCSQLAESRQVEGYSEQEQQCLEHFLQITHNLRPHLIHCYDVVGLPRTNNDMERSIRSLKTRYRRISGRKNWNSYLVRYGSRVANSRLLGPAARWGGSPRRTAHPRQPSAMARGPCSKPREPERVPQALALPPQAGSLLTDFGATLGPDHLAVLIIALTGFF